MNILFTKSYKFNNFLEHPPKNIPETLSCKYNSLFKQNLILFL